MPMLKKSDPLGLIIDENTGQSWLNDGTNIAKALSPRTEPLTADNFTTQKVRPFSVPKLLIHDEKNLEFIPRFRGGTKQLVDAIIPLPVESGTGKILLLPTRDYAAVAEVVKHIYQRFQILYAADEKDVIAAVTKQGNFAPILVRGFSMKNQVFIRQLDTLSRNRHLILFVDDFSQMIVPRETLQPSVNHSRLKDLWADEGKGFDVWALLTTWAKAVYVGVTYEDQDLSKFMNYLPDWENTPWTPK